MSRFFDKLFYSPFGKKERAGGRGSCYDSQRRVIHQPRFGLLHRGGGRAPTYPIFKVLSLATRPDISPALIYICGGDNSARERERRRSRKCPPRFLPSPRIMDTTLFILSLGKMKRFLWNNRFDTRIFSYLHPLTD